MSVVIKVENLSKYYRLGVIGGGTLREDLGRWWAVRRGKPDPLLKIGQEDHGNRKDGQIWALRDVSLEVREGEVLGIIGGNGAGKSTLLKIISRITAPTHGRIKINGRIASLLEVGTGFHPELTGRENAYLNGAILGMSRREVASKLEEIVEFAEMNEFIDTPVKRYSSGMTVRLAFAVAAHLEPEIMVIDEVLAVGDAAFQKKCLGKMQSVAQQGRTILFVSHNMAAINNLCGRAVLLQSGEVVRTGKAREVTQVYLGQAHPSRKCVDRSNCKKLREDGVGGHISINTVSVFGDENSAGTIYTGGPMSVAIDYKRHADVRSPAFAIHIRDPYGTELLRLSTQPISGFDVGHLHPEGRVRIKIPKLPLVAGIYSLDIGFARQNVEWLIRLENLLQLEVLPNDVYRSGLALDSSRGLIVTPHRWEHFAV